MSTHPLHRRRMVLVSVAMLAVIGLAAGCQMAPPPRTSHSPSGYLDSVVAGSIYDKNVGEYFGVSWPWPGPARFLEAQGWAVDWDAPLIPVPIAIAVVQNGQLTWRDGWRAATYRPDVDAAFPETNRNLAPYAGHGIDNPNIPVLPDSTATVCVVALNTDGPGDNTILGCQTVTT